MARHAARTPRIVAVIPALDEAGYIGEVVTALGELRDEGRLDRLLVVDGGSTDATAEIAAAGGAEVVAAADLAPSLGTVLGKGDSMWRAASLLADGDVAVFLDGDVQMDFERAITELSGPLLGSPHVQLVKGSFERIDRTGAPLKGGRVTESVARPLIAALASELSDVAEPLSGQIGIRSSTLRRLSILTGYGVDLGILLDVHDAFGRSAIAQADLGTLVNSVGPDEKLEEMAHDVVAAALLRRGGHTFPQDRAEQMFGWCRTRLVERPPWEPKPLNEAERSTPSSVAPPQRWS